MLCNVNSFSLRNMFSFQRQGRNVSLNTKGAKSKGHACVKNSYSFNNIEFSKGSYFFQVLLAINYKSRVVDKNLCPFL